MARKRYSAEQIILKLREAEVLLAQGQTVWQISRSLEISEQTYYRWRREYGGMDTVQAKKLKELEKQNGRLKKLVADLSLDNAILKEAISKNIISFASKGARRRVASWSSKSWLHWRYPNDASAGHLGNGVPHNAMPGNPLMRKPFYGSALLIWPANMDAMVIDE